MVKWYNESLPRISRGFDYPWPHTYFQQKSPQSGIFCFENSVRPEQPAGSRLRG